MPISENHKTQKFLLLGLYLKIPLVLCTVNTEGFIAKSKSCSCRARVQNDKKFYISVNISQPLGAYVFALSHTHIVPQSILRLGAKGQSADERRVQERAKCSP